MSFQKNPLDARMIGVKVVYALLRKTVKDTVEDFIETMEVNPIDAADIRYRLLTKEFLDICVPCSTDEEMDAMDWLCDVRSRLKR